MILHDLHEFPQHRPFQNSLYKNFLTPDQPPHGRRYYIIYKILYITYYIIYIIDYILYITYYVLYILYLIYYI